MAQKDYKDFTTITKNIDYLRLTTLITILWFIIIFNLERFAIINGQPIFNLHMVSYASLIIVGLLTLAFPNISQINWLYVFLPIIAIQQIIYFIIQADTSMGINRIPYDAIALAITLFLMRRLGNYLLGAEDNLQDYMLTDETLHVLPYETARQQAADELDHLRQIGGTMALIYCRVYTDDAKAENTSTLEQVLSNQLNASFLARYLQVRLGRFIVGVTYTTDIVFEYGYGIAVCLPETNQEDATKFLHQLNGFLSTEVNLTLWTGQAFFTEQSSSFDDMLNQAKSNMKLYVPSKDLTDDVVRVGDVSVSIPDRLRIEAKSEWVNKLAYQSPTARAIYSPIKRLMDIVIAGTALILLSPLLAVIALAVMIDDGWPIFYSHKRVGKGGKTFLMHKFRSMYKNAPALEPKIVHLSDGSIRYDWPEKDEDDPRITRVGRFLRRTSLDELPQIWNILTGTMSVIGPRPSSWKLDQHTLHQTARLTVKPGLTGLWQVSARDSKNFDERLLWDLKYVEKMGLWLDIQILLRTAGAVLRRSGV